MMEELTLAAKLASIVATEYKLEWDKVRLVYFKVFQNGSSAVMQKFSINTLSEYYWANSTWIVGEMLDNAEQELMKNVNEGKEGMVEM